MRVAVLPTGRMELRGLPGALNALFPAHRFDAISMRSKDEEPFNSFTSSGKPLPLNQPNGNADKIVQQMAAELVPGRDGRAPDLFVVLEDLEVENAHQPQVVVQVFREAISRHVGKLREGDAKFASKVEEALQSKASFHLATPMIESWLFADPDGPRNAGVPADRLPPTWESARDPEDFLTRDPIYLADDCSTCTAWRALLPRRSSDHKPAWLRDHRELHPKGFLAWLCRDAAEKKCSRYRETHEGADALKVLNWKAALSSLEHCTVTPPRSACRAPQRAVARGRRRYSMPKTLARGLSTYLTRRRWTPKDAKAALRALAQSGLPLATFASHKGLDAQRLVRWRRRLCADAPETLTFEEVSARPIASAFGGGATPPSERDRFELVLRSGLVVRVAESFTTDALRRLLDVLGEVRSC